MVYLNRIYTRGGDGGETSLGNGDRVSKTHPRIRVFGGVDELNAVLGIARTAELPADLDHWLMVIQNDLFDMGADLCVPEAASDPSNDAAPAEASQCLRVLPEQTLRLEQWIDEVNGQLEPLTSFILPGGHPASAWLHLARTVCRRVEADAWELARDTRINPEVMKYLNRLSDLLFVLARYCNNRGRDCVLWVPGGQR